MDNQIPYLAEWLRLAKSGDFEKASELYFDKLFEVVIDSFSERFQNVLPKGGILFSILGFSPEPIILTAKAMAPQTHIIFTTNSKTEGNEYLDKYLGTSYEIVYLSDESFVSIFKALKEQLILHPSSKIALDITGGKKSMVASASIFGKDYGCTIVYVDFKDYLKDLRKPIPGSELLNVVYDPMQHQPELFLK